MQARHLLPGSLIAAAAIVAAVGITRAVVDFRPWHRLRGVADIGGPFTLVDDTGAEVT